MLTCVTDLRPFPLHRRLNDYKHDCLEFGLNTEYFHCSEDNRHVRDRVFEVIGDHLEQIRIDTLVVERRKRTAIEKAIRGTLKHMLPPTSRYRLLHHASKSHFGLQVADYCNWAIFRKWTRGDNSHYERIRPAIASEFEIFRKGTTLYY